MEIIISIKIEAIVRNVGKVRIKEALLLAKLQPQIDSRLKLNTEYIINEHAYFRYISKFLKRIKNKNLKKNQINEIK